MSTTSTLEPPTPSRRELLVAAGVIALMLALPLVVPALRVMYLKPLWLDELTTWMLSRELPGRQLLDQLRRGADYNPPLLYVIDSLALHAFPGLPPQLVVRLTSLVAVWVATVLVYRISRQRLGVLPSATAVVALLAQSALMEQIHEARYYAPLVALVAAAAWSMQAAVERPSVRHLVQLAIATAAVCLMHYFGTIALACLALGLAVHVRSPTRLLPVAAAMAVGSLALAAWFPVYAAQRRMMPVTWIGAPTPSASADFLQVYFGSYVLLSIVAAAVVWTLFRTQERWASIPRPGAAQSALLGLLAMPFLLIAFSYLVQPALITRYALPAVLGVATVVAIASALLPRGAQLLALLGVLAAHVVLLRQEVWDDRAFDREVRVGVATINAVAGDSRPILSMQRWVLYPVALSQANRNANLAFVVASDARIDEHFGANEQNARNFTISERDATVVHHRVLGLPPLIDLDSMRRLPGFYWLVRDSAAAIGWPERFYGFRACRASSRLLRFDPSPGLTQSTRAIESAPPCDARAENR